MSKQRYIVKALLEDKDAFLRGLKHSLSLSINAKRNLILLVPEKGKFKHTHAAKILGEPLAKSLLKSGSIPFPIDEENSIQIQLISHTQFRAGSAYDVIYAIYAHDGILEKIEQSYFEAVVVLQWLGDDDTKKWCNVNSSITVV